MMTPPTETDGVTLVVEGPLDRSTVTRWHKELQPRLRTATGEVVGLHLGDVTGMDSAGAALCSVLRQQAQRDGRELRLVGASVAAREALAVFRVRLDGAGGRPPRPGVFERAGAAALGQWEGLVHFAALVTDTFYYTVTGLFSRRNRIRFGATVDQMVRIGLESLGIVSLISLLVGLTVALQSAAQLLKFGANIFLVDLVGVAMTREMGPLMTAIILAGRCGSSIAAEIATMQITEEVDALRAMGVQPVRFLVVPRYLAITITQPLLTMVANALGILGGMIIAVTYLDLGPSIFMDRLLSSLYLKDVLTGLVKSVAFAWIIVFVGSHRGFRVRGGAEGVGIATTGSVVQAIFLVIVADAFFSLLFYF